MIYFILFVVTICLLTSFVNCTAKRISTVHLIYKSDVQLNHEEKHLSNDMILLLKDLHVILIKSIILY